MKNIFLLIVSNILFIALYAQKNQGGNNSLMALVKDKPTGSNSFTPSNVVASCTSSGTITRELWANVTGTSVVNIPVNSTPTNTSQLTSFEEPSSFGDHYYCFVNFLITIFFSVFIFMI